MFKNIISEFRSHMMAGPHPDEHQSDDEYRMRPSKSDRAAERVGHLLSTPLEHFSRRKMRKMVPHIHHHFTKGHGSGEGEYRTVDMDDLSTLSRIAQEISDKSNEMMRMPGSAHHMSAHLCKHVADAHGRMSKYFRDHGQEESADLCDNEHMKFRNLHKHHRKHAKRHGYYEDGGY